MAPAKKALQLFVHNLPWTANAQKLKTYFAKFGSVSNANVVFDRNTGFSKGFGFVYFSDNIGYNAAIETKDHTLDGFTFKVSK